MGKWALTVVSSTVLVAGCSLLTDLTGLTGGALSTDDRDASSPADATLDAATLDAFVPSDAGSDTSSSSPCGSGPPTRLVGSNDLTNTIDDRLAVGVFDTYGYLATTDGLARCAWLYASGVPISGAFTLAVYANDASTDDPAALLAKARLTSVAIGWNAAPLDKPVVVAAGQTLWLGFSGESEGGAIRTLQGCATALSNHVGEGLGAVPRDPFVLVNEYPTNCGAAAYLAP